MKLGSFIFGLVVGAGLGALGSLRYFKKKFQDEADAEIESMKRYYENALDRIEYERISTELGYKADEHKEDEIKEDRKNEKVTKPDAVDYTKFYEAEKIVEEEAQPMVKETAKPKNSPRVILPEEFRNNSNFDYMTLNYYVDSDLLTNDEESPYDIEIAEHMIGNLIEETDFKNSPDRVMYIRNEKYGCDYEIVKVRGQYVGD